MLVNLKYGVEFTLACTASVDNFGPKSYLNYKLLGESFAIFSASCVVALNRPLFYGLVLCL